MRVQAGWVRIPPCAPHRFPPRLLEKPPPSEGEMPGSIPGVGAHIAEVSDDRVVS